MYESKKDIKIKREVENEKRFLSELERERTERPYWTKWEEEFEADDQYRPDYLIR